MIDDDDDFFDDDDAFDDDGDEGDAGGFGDPPWKVLVVDDEPDIHDVTKLALRDFRYHGRELRLLRAESGQEARSVVDSTPEIALIILDVVMESDHAGLDFARWLRDERGILDTRIVLRTGQPGQAPERQVILGYDINDYKAKSELTADRLFTCVVAALRGFNDLQENEALRQQFAASMDEQGRAERVLLDLLPLPVLQSDAMGQITGANAALAALTDAPDEDALIGQDCAGWLPSDLLAAWQGEGDGEVEIRGRLYQARRRVIGDDPDHPLGKVLCLVPVGAEG